eukprot:15255051-Ditylum_brightwellii.AAC.1
MQHHFGTGRTKHLLETTVAVFQEKGYHDPDPRKLFLHDFTAFIDKRIENNEELIIGIDANETDEVDTDLYKFITDNDLVDTFKHAHPDVTPPNTYQRSNN